MSIYLRAGMVGYQYAGLTVEDALARHRAGKRPPVLAIFVSDRDTAAAVPEEVDGLPVRRGKLPTGTVYLVTDTGKTPLESQPVQAGLALELN